MWDFLNNIKNYIVNGWDYLWGYQATQTSRPNLSPPLNTYVQGNKSVTDASPVASSSNPNPEENGASTEPSSKRKRRRKKKKDDTKNSTPSDPALSTELVSQSANSETTELAFEPHLPAPATKHFEPLSIEEPLPIKLDTESSEPVQSTEFALSEPVHVNELAPTRTEQMQVPLDELISEVSSQTQPIPLIAKPSVHELVKSESAQSVLPKFEEQSDGSNKKTSVLSQKGAKKTGTTPGSSSKKVTSPSSTNEKNKKEKAEVLAKSTASKPKIPGVVTKKEPVAPVKNKKTNSKVTASTVASSSATFFSSSPKNKKSVVHFLKRSQLPEAMMHLVDKLRDKFPSARFYLTGAAPADILDDLKPNDYDLLIVDNSSIFQINDFLQSQQYKSEIRSFRYPVIFCDLDKGLTLDFSIINTSPNLSLQQLLERDYHKRDFNLNALYCELTQKDDFEVFSFSNALHERNKKVIGFANDQITSFEDDPTRLFRLCNLLIKHPEYSLKKDIKEALLYLNKTEKGIPKWYEIFYHYIKLEHGNKDRLNHAMRKLFMRHSYEDINNALHRLGLLSSFTDNSKTTADAACAHIPPVAPQHKFIFWLMANVLQRFESGKTDQALPLHPFLYLTYMEHAHLSYAYSKGPKAVPLYPRQPIQEIEALISQFTLPEKDIGHTYSFTH